MEVISIQSTMSLAIFTPKLSFKNIYLKEGIYFAFINNSYVIVTNFNSHLLLINESLPNQFLNSSKEKKNV